MVEDKEKHLFFPRVWLYARTSTKDHDVVDWQLSELADWAAQEGYRVVGRSYDFASPKVIWCSGLSAMLHVVRRGEVDGRNLDLELGAHKEKTDQDLGNFAKAQCGFDYNRRKSAVSALPVWSGYSAGQAYHEKGG